jgi:2,3-bisphosphoglycerate-dependent phosphoglycerate mutase
LPYWYETIQPALKAGKQVLVAAHGNSLRAIVKYLDNMSSSEIMGVNIPTGFPLVYELDEDLNVIRHYYLGDKEKIRKAREVVARQISVKEKQ